TFPRGMSGTKIVGYYVDAGGNYHGFLYDGLTFSTLDDPAAEGVTFVSGIAGNFIVGSYNVGSDYYGFLYNGETYFHFVTPFPTGFSGISPTGDIVASYNSGSGLYRGLLTRAPATGAFSSRHYTVAITPPVAVTTASLANWTSNQPGY